MYESDWLLRQIKNLVSSLLRVLYQENDVSYVVDEDSELSGVYAEAEMLLKNGDISTAEEFLFKNIDINNENYLKMVLHFYSVVSDYDSDYFKKNNYDEEQFEFGINRFLSAYGINFDAFKYNG